MVADMDIPLIPTELHYLIKEQAVMELREFQGSPMFALLRQGADADTGRALASAGSDIVKGKT